MFGLNDTGAQSANDNDSSQASAQSDHMMQSNPFADTPAPAPAPMPLPSVDSNPVTSAAPSTVDSQPPTESNPDSKPGDLLDLKEQALTSLQPLVGHLDQTPEEKFKTTMMLIQATDNSALVKEAYAAANQIPDEKARAQALLDVVNEINYFTQHNGEAEDKPQQL